VLANLCSLHFDLSVWNSEEEVSAQFSALAKLVEMRSRLGGNVCQLAELRLRVNESLHQSDDAFIRRSFERIEACRLFGMRVNIR
jgi:hypothetical protein